MTYSTVISAIDIQIFKRKTHFANTLNKDTELCKPRYTCTPTHAHLLSYSPMHKHKNVFK